MKTILIEGVSNGWIVRPFSPCESWMKSDCPEIAVFTTIESLAEALPRLLTDFRQGKVLTSQGSQE